jgi:hypothetical protein
MGNPTSTISSCVSAWAPQLTLLRFLGVEWCQILDHAKLLADYNSSNADKRLYEVSVFQVLSLETYLNSKVEKVQIPVGSRYAVFVGNCHRYRSTTVCKNRNRGAVCDVGKGLWCRLSRARIRSGQERIPL